MTKQEAEQLRSFKHYCQCGHTMDGRDPRRPHLSWCPQAEEYNEWYDALYSN